ncbi:MAG: hypothetical protein ACFFDF_02320 [Candidatus Odinarchaeota archaeon]
MIIKEKNFWGEDIKTPEEIIEDLCDRLNTVYNTVMEEEDKMQQLAYLIGAITGITGRLSRVCGRG